MFSIRTPEQCPSVVSLLSESYNPHVRYGAAMALGICCAGTGNKVRPQTNKVSSFLAPGFSAAEKYENTGAVWSLRLSLAHSFIVLPTLTCLRLPRTNNNARGQLLRIALSCYMLILCLISIVEIKIAVWSHPKLTLFLLFLIICMCMCTWVKMPWRPETWDSPDGCNIQSWFTALI